jgi:small subunit ribosomal protein S14
MAKRSMIERDKRRTELSAKYAVRRAELRELVKNLKLSPEERIAAAEKLQKLPRDSARTRIRNRCALTGRPRGFYRKFGMARNELRKAILRGDAPGVVKASW